MVEIGFKEPETHVPRAVHELPARCPLCGGGGVPACTTERRVHVDRPKVRRSGWGEWGSRERRIGLGCALGMPPRRFGSVESGSAGEQSC
jgi:hypothetical protein